MSENKGFPWHDVMRFVIGRLHFSPEQFWQMSLPELATLLHPFAQPTSILQRQELQKLIHQYPDE